MARPGAGRMAWLVVAAAAVLCAAGVHAATTTVTTNPTLPLLDVAFCATASSSASGGTLFVSRKKDCSDSLAEVLTSGTCPTTGSYAFNVTSASLVGNLETPVQAVPATYWCVRGSGGSSMNVGTLQMNVVQTSPMYVIQSTDSTLTFNEATPVGTTIGFFTLPDCTSPLPKPPQFTLDSKRSVVLNTNAATVYICASISSVVTGGTGGAMALRNTIVGGTAYTITPTEGVRHSTVTIATGQSGIVYYALSTSSTCSDLSVPTSDQISVGNRMTVMPVFGTYYFCGAGTDRVYMPASNTFSVVEYGVQPHTTYAGQATTVSLSLNATSWGMQQMALFTSQRCSGDAMQDWGGRLWTVATAGTYYACVRRNASSAAYYANQFIVTEMPKLTSKPTDAVFGFPLTVSVGGSLLSGASYAIALSANGGCSGLLATAELSAGTTSASLQIPVDTADTTYYYCLMNPKALMNASDTSEETTVRYYKAGSVAARFYRLGYDALRAGDATDFMLDTAVSLSTGTAVSFVPTTAAASVADVCGGTTGSSGVNEVVTQVTSGNMLTGVTFPRAGMWAACANVGSAYTLLRRVTVYSAAASLTRTTLLVSAAASVTVGDVPAGAAVTIVSGSACGTSPLVSGTSSDAGTVTLSVTAPTAGTASVCVAYPGASATSASPPAPRVLKAASLTVVQPLSYPSVAFTSGTTTLRFTGVGGASLQDYTMKLVKAEDCSPAALSSPVVSEPLSQPSSDVAGAWGAGVSGSALESTHTYAVCVGIDSSTAYSMAGTVTAVAMPDAKADTSTRSSAAAGLPVHVALPLDFVRATGVDAYVVVSGATDCTAGVASVIAKGSIDAATGTTAAFVPTEAGATLTVCVVAQKHLLGDRTLGYVRAMPLSVVPFGTSTTQVQVNRTNDVGGEPLSLIPGTQLLLAACTGSGCSSAEASATCHNSTLLLTNSTVSLQVRAAHYVVCQRVQLSGVTYMVGSNTSVQAVAPYVLSLDASPLRAYVPASVTLRGGPAGSGRPSGRFTVTVQPASVECGATTATSQRFDVTDGSGSVTVTAVSPGQDVVFCLADTSLGNRTLLRAPLKYYMWPIAVIAGRATTVTSGSTANGLFAKLSSTLECNDVVAGGGEHALVNHAAAFTVDGCDTTTSSLATVYYCEKSGSSGTWASRGPMGLLRASNCSGGEAASIGMVYAAPGVALTSYGIGPSAYLTAPRLSATDECTSLVDGGVGTVGYAPAMDESAVFHVCAQVVGDATLVFTTTVPTLTVRNWAVEPRAALSRYNATMGTQPSPSLSLNYAAPSANTFLSTAPDCGASLAAASGLAATGGVVAYRTVGVSGLVYVCTTNPLTSQPVAVAAFLSVTPPRVTQAAPAIVRGGTYTATLVVPGPSPLYSMQPNEDREYTYHSYYTSDDRSVYLSVDSCVSSLAGTEVTKVDSNGRVSFVTSSIALGVSSVTLCTGTAAGVAETLSVSVAPGKVYPTRLVSGVSGAPTYMPTYPSTAFQLSRSNGDCSARAGMPTFTTDSQGYGTVSLLDEHGAALAVGIYTLCTGGTAAGVRAADALADGGVTALDTVELVAASHFAVRGTTFVVGVPGTMELLQDLRSGYLLDGLSTTADCTSMTTAYGSWSAVSDTTVSVNATAESASPLYMCAVAPVNASSIALPGGASSVVFAASSIALPPDGWDACSQYTLDQCVAPGSGTASSSSSDVLAMVHGDCCSSTRVVVGESDMSGATCRLSLDYAAVASYGSGATFNLCVLRRDDASVCTTVASGVSVSTACPRPTFRRRLSGGAIAGIVLGCVVGGLLLIGVGAFVVYHYCLGDIDTIAGRDLGYSGAGRRR